MPSEAGDIADEPGIAVGSYANAWRPKDTRSRGEWGEEYVSPPGSARGTKVDLSVSPWLREPIDFSEDNRVKEQVVMMPTGAGKTTLFDVIVPHSIAEDPGGILLGLQSIPDAKEYVEERLLPILKGAAPVADILGELDRYAIRKGAVMFPGRPLYLGSGQDLTSLQRRSVRYVLIDEAWRWKHGFIAEARARTHDRWNSRIIIVSQGGMATILRDAGQIETELQSAWVRTDRREWNFQCPQCAEVQRYRMKCLRYEHDPESRSAVDENAIFQSARYMCAGHLREKQSCDAVFEDRIDVRRMLANTGRYVAQNPSHLAHHHGWHMSALGLYYVAHGTLAVEHAKAMRALKDGDESAIRIYRQKRLAENIITEQKVETSALTVGMIEDPNAPGGLRPYTFEDYTEGQRWPGENRRILTFDVQKDHFWVVIRAWKTDGSSRRLWAGKVNTLATIRDMQHRYHVADLFVFGDSSYDANTVYNACGLYGWRAFQGDQAMSFKFTPRRGRPYWKFFSQVRPIAASTGKLASLIFWATTPIKRILEKMRDGKRAPWEVEGDMDAVHLGHLFNEVERDQVSKITRKLTRVFVPMKKNFNHTWDCEAMQVSGALIGNMLRDEPDPSHIDETPRLAPEPEEAAAA